MGRWFQEEVKKQRINGKVPVIYSDINDSILYVPCNKKGIPNIRVWEFMTLMGLPKALDWTESTEYSPTDPQIYKKSVMINQPEIVFRVAETSNPLGEDYYFMWRGDLVDKQEIPIEQLDVKYLMRLAQEAIEKREPIILDEVTKHKLIK